MSFDDSGSEFDPSQGPTYVSSQRGSGIQAVTSASSRRRRMHVAVKARAGVKATRSESLQP